MTPKQSMAPFEKGKSILLVGLCTLDNLYLDPLEYRSAPQVLGMLFASGVATEYPKAAPA